MELQMHVMALDSTARVDELQSKIYNGSILEMKIRITVRDNSMKWSPPNHTCVLGLC